MNSITHTHIHTYIHTYVRTHIHRRKECHMAKRLILFSDFASTACVTPHRTSGRLCRWRPAAAPAYGDSKQRKERRAYPRFVDPPDGLICRWQDYRKSTDASQSLTQAQTQSPPLQDEPQEHAPSAPRPRNHVALSYPTHPYPASI